MKHLSGLDATFLHLETPEMPMHVGGLNLFQLPEGYHGSFYDDVKAHIGRRMHLAGLFNKKLALMPFDLANPVWVDDGDIDLDYHVRQITLPKPGTMAQLEAYVGRLHSSLLDRSRPLWEFYVFDGLESGQAACYSKIHHAALDGQGATVLAQAILDVSPIPREVEPPPARTRPPYQPGMGEMANAALRDTLRQCWVLVKAVPEVLKVVGNLIKPSKKDSLPPGAVAPAGFSMGPKTILNVSVTNQRVFATAKLSFDEVKQVSQAFDATLNDVLLAICSGAMRQYLESKGPLPRKSLVAALPVSLRAEGDTKMNNQVSMMLVNLATNVADPTKRIQSIVKASGTMKKTLKKVKSVLPTDFPSLGVPWLMSGLVSLYGRSKLADSIPPIANVVISNVPGPRMPLYLAGARMMTGFPVSIVAHGLGLNITVQSYDGAFDFGFIACRRAMPDVSEFAKIVEQMHRQLMQAAAEHMKTKPAPAAAAVKAGAKPGAKAGAKSGAKAPAKAAKPAAKAKTATKKLSESIIVAEPVAEPAAELVPAAAPAPRRLKAGGKLAGLLKN
jgi:diacylglycerol O-acyltransferase